MAQGSSPFDLFAQRLETLKRQFVAGLPTRVAALRQALTGSEPADVRAASLRESCHKLAGTAGSYGYAEVTERAREIEIALLEGADVSGVTPRAEALVRLLEGIAAEGATASDAPREADVPSPRPGAPAPAGAGEVRAASAPSRAAPKRVLVIDDDEATRRLIGLTLSRLGGHEPVVVGSGAEGLELLDGRPFDLVIVDAMMPDMNGPTFIRLLRSTKPAYASTRVVICSAASPDEVAVPLDPPPDGWLRKPIRPQGLLAELEPYLAQAT